MSKATTWTIWSGLFLALLLAVFLALDLHGNLDPGKFEILRTVSDGGNEVAIVARRSDHQALNGDQYAVFVADHIYSPKELKLAYHHRHAAVFNIDRGGFQVSWANPRELVIDCSGCGITRNDINVQEFRSGDVSVRYLGIPNP